MVAKHQHKAWIGWELIKLIFGNIGPIFVYHSVSFVIALVFGGIAIVGGVFGGQLHLFNNPHVTRWSAGITEWMWKLVDNSAPEVGSFGYVIIQMPLMFMFAFLIVVPFMILLGIPLLYQMKVNGMIAKHFSHSLDLDQRIMPFTPAGFWVRFLAYCVDILLVPLAPLVVTRDKRFVMGGLAFYGIIVYAGLFFGWKSAFLLATVLPIAENYMNWMYFAVSHSGAIRATLGMEAFGLIVIPDIPNPRQKDLDKSLTLGQATKRWFSVNFVTNLTFGLGFLVCAFHPQKKALHDMISKSKVVFEGDK